MHWAYYHEQTAMFKTNSKLQNSKSSQNIVVLRNSFLYQNLSSRRSSLALNTHILIVQLVSHVEKTMIKSNAHYCQLYLSIYFCL